MIYNLIKGKSGRFSPKEIKFMNKSRLIFNRRLLAIVISFALVLVSLVGFTLLRSSDVAHADPTGSWTDENNYDTSWYDGHESDTEYTLTTSAQFAGLAYLVNNGTTTFSGKTVNLGATISLAGHYWVPIGNGSTYYFAGTFGGEEIKFENYVLNRMAIIYDMTVNATADHAGLFGYVNGATIRNVILHSGCSVTSTGNSVGSIVGMADTGTAIKNVTNNGCSVTGTGNGNHYGGIVGIACSGTTIENVINQATISGSYCVGGIIGKIDVNNVSIKKAINNGNVTGTGSAGGIVGFAYSGTTIENVTNRGEVTGTYDIGGIVGYAQIGTVIVKNATNSGV